MNEKKITEHDEPIELFEVTELDDEDLEDAAGGSNGNCGCVPK